MASVELRNKQCTVCGVVAKKSGVECPWSAIDCPHQPTPAELDPFARSAALGAAADHPLPEMLDRATWTYGVAK